jgi:hypothetical protein
VLMGVLVWCRLLVSRDLGVFVGISVVVAPGDGQGKAGLYSSRLTGRRGRGNGAKAELLIMAVPVDSFCGQFVAIHHGRHLQECFSKSWLVSRSGQRLMNLNSTTE